MDLANLHEGDKLLQLQNKIKKVFFYRICGTGMGAAACLLKEKGYQVEGADASFSPPMSTYLESTGIPCHKLTDVNLEFLKKFDLIVVGNSVPRTSEHAKLIEECGIPFTSFPSIIGAFVLREKNVIGIAGTHGKTTTTYLMTQVFQKLGANPGHFIGGIMDDMPPARIGKGDYFFIESDEYDSAYFQKFSKFRQYEIKHLILTSLEFDHADIFASMEKIEDEFKAAIPKIPKSFLFSADYSSSVKLFEQYKKLAPEKRWALYGEKAEIGPFNLKSQSSGTEFSLKLDGKEEKFETNLVGKQNILNLSSAIIFAYQEKFSLDNIRQAIKELSMVKRRQEVRGHYKDAVVIDDFAHHPTAVTITMDSIIDRYPGRPLVVVMEPVSATARSSIFQNEFRDSLGKAKRVIIANPGMKTSAINAKDLDMMKLAKELTDMKGIPSIVANDLEQLRTTIDLYIKECPKSVLLILSNRTCLGLWESSFVKELKK